MQAASPAWRKAWYAKKIPLHTVKGSHLQHGGSSTINYSWFGRNTSRTSRRQVSWLADRYTRPPSRFTPVDWMAIHSLLTVTRSHRLCTCFPFNTHPCNKRCGHRLLALFSYQSVTHYTTDIPVVKQKSCTIYIKRLYAFSTLLFWNSGLPLTTLRRLVLLRCIQ